MIELTLSVSSGLSEKKKINFFHFRDFFSRGRRKENGRTLSRERRSIPQRSEFFFFFFFFEKREGKKRTILRNTFTISSKSCDSLDQQPVCA